jgi:hypothetical protein
LGKIKQLRATAQKLSNYKDVKSYYDHSRSYASELATELLRLNPDIPPLE